MNESATDKRIVRLYNDYKIDKAKKLILKNIERYENSHFFLTILASSYRIEGDLENAFKYIVLAFSIKDSCPTVLWHLADIYNARGEVLNARVVWRHLLKKNKLKLLNDPCSESEAILNQLLNDVRYELYESYLQTNRKVALRYFRLYKKYKI